MTKDWDEGPKEEHKEGQCGPPEGQPEFEKACDEDNSGQQWPSEADKVEASQKGITNQQKA